MSRAALLTLVAAGLTLAALPAVAQSIGGHAFEDRNANGVLDPGEPTLDALTVELFGHSDATGAVDTSTATAADGSFLFTPGNGCYLLRPDAPAGWRPAPTRDDRFARVPGTSDPSYPVGTPRFGFLDQGLGHLRAGTLRYSALGDSIATNFNFCEFANLFGSFTYSERLRDRLACTAPGAAISIDEDAVKGQHTDDLLVDDTSDLNNAFRIIDAQPQLVSLSMIGNDLLDVDVDNPTQQQVAIAVDEIVDARRNLQEALSSMLSGVPGLDITLNTLYDNLAYNCYGGAPTSSFHRQWIPIINQILRDLAWGQVRPLAVNEVSSEFAVEDQLGSCSGFSGMICTASSDGIHPRQIGYDIVAEKLWEAAAGINLGSRDILGRTAFGGVDYGFLRRVRRLHPTAWQTLGGAAAASPEAAFDDDDGGASASIALGANGNAFLLSGFPDWYDEIRLVKVVAGVRYHTSGSFTQQLYRIEASPSGVFDAPPGHVFTPTDWNFSTPIVGGGGPNAPASKPDYSNEKLLVRPNVATPREVSATLTTNPVLNDAGTDYEWPPLTADDLATTAIRVAAANVGADPGSTPRVELDAAWLDLYGWEAPRPAEVAHLRVDPAGGGSIEVGFDAVPGAQRYNLYTGRLATVRVGAYDHGDGAPAGPDCDATTTDLGGGRLAIDAATPGDDVYFLVTAHVDDVESPAGTRSDGEEIDRSRSTCR